MSLNYYILFGITAFATGYVVYNGYKLLKQYWDKKFAKKSTGSEEKQQQQ